MRELVPVAEKWQVPEDEIAEITGPKCFVVLCQREDWSDVIRCGSAGVIVLNELLARTGRFCVTT
jgi:hypothetical protein